MGQKLFQVDSFTTRPFSGNPAGVCLLESDREAEWMQDLAMEMNLSETAYVEPQGNDFGLRWFTPTREMDLCGHATLASAHILWETGVLRRNDPARFHTRSGLLTVRNLGDWLEMDFPVWKTEPAEIPEGLDDAIGARALDFVHNHHFGLVQLESVEQVKALSPDFRKLKSLPLEALIVTARDDGSPYDFQSRVFAPQMGIDEDPVTGGAHCMLAPYWSERMGKSEMMAWQCSKRGGELRVENRGERVILRGQAVTVFDIEMAG